jgi:uncharacterized protein (TIGR03435 family)
MKTLVAGLLAVCLSIGAELKTGSAAPPLTLQQVLQAPPGTGLSWQELKGTSLVIEFWATWCGGCREQIPHLNRLAEQFQGKPLRFLSLTDEDQDVVQRFLKDHPISGWIGLDANEQTYKRYGINGRPTTVLVDAAGMVRGIGNAADLTGDTLDSLLSGRPVAFSMESGAAAKLQALPEPLYELMIRPAGPVDATGYSPGAVSGQPGRRWETWGVPLRRLLSDAFAVPEDRIEAPGWAAANRYDVALAAPDFTEARGVAMLRRLLEDNFQLKEHQESRDPDVCVLRRIPGTDPKLRPSSLTGSSGWGKAGDITAVNRAVASIAFTAEQALRKTVVDETKLAGRYDFELKWNTADRQSLIDAVRAQLGLELAAAKRPLVYLVVDSASPPRSW